MRWACSEFKYFQRIGLGFGGLYYNHSSSAEQNKTCSKVLVIFIQIRFLFGTNQIGTLGISHDDHQITYGPHNPQEYTTSLSSISSQYRNGKPDFPSLIKSYMISYIGLMTRLSCASSPSFSSVRVFNVDDFGAKGDGTDDRKKAWKGACSSKEGGVILVPRDRVYHLRPMNFTVKASSHRTDYVKDKRHWIMFVNVEYLRVEGGGTFNGNGEIWW
ncbi:Pectin lyase fold containing protein, partial [Trema orientale]